MKTATPSCAFTSAHPRTSAIWSRTPMAGTSPHESAWVQMGPRTPRGQCSETGIAQDCPPSRGGSLGRWRPGAFYVARDLAVRESSRSLRRCCDPGKGPRVDGRRRGVEGGVPPAGAG
jgi:hypothetical protein